MADLSYTPGGLTDQQIADKNAAADANNLVSRPPPTSYVAPQPATYPVLSADQATQDLTAKQTNFNQIDAGVANQQLANTQTTALQTATDQNQATIDAASKPSQTLDEIKSMMSGDQTNQALADINVQSTQAYNDYKAQVDSIRNGTFPLSSDEQAQITDVQKTLDRLTAQQITANKNYEGAITNLGITSGRERYAPEIQTGLIKGAIDEGITKVQDIESKGAATMAQLRQAFKDNDYKLINDSYTALTNYLNQKTNVINQMAATVREEANFALQLHNQQVQEAQQALQNKFQQSQVDFQKQQFAYQQQQDLRKFAIDNKITQPFYQLGDQIINAATGQAQFIQNGQEIDSIDGTKKYSSPKQFFADAGISSFDQIQKLSSTTDLSKYPTSYQEYVLAKQEGYKGTYNDYQTMDANRKAVRNSTTNITYNQAKDQAQTQAASTIGNAFSSLVGSDGYISPTDWKQGLQKWTSAGYSASDFIKQFSNYLNPTEATKGSYGVVQ